MTRFNSLASKPRTRAHIGVLAAAAVLLVAGLVRNPAGTTRITWAMTGKSASSPPAITADLHVMVILMPVLIATVVAAWLSVGPRVASGRRRTVVDVLLLSFSAALLIVAVLSWAAVGKQFSVTALLSASLIRALPVALAALAAVVCERAGVINVAVEGQLVLGACAAAVTASVTNSIALGIAASIFAALLLGQVLSTATVKYQADQMMTGIVLILFATGLTGFFAVGLLTRRPELNSPPVAKDVAIPVLGDVPVLGPIFFDTSGFVMAAFLVAVAVTFFLTRTRIGLRLRAVGENPRAVDTVGVDVLRTRWIAVLLASLIAGIGGAYFTIGSVGQFFPGMIAGKGFVGLAAVIVGNWSPARAAAAALLFGMTDAIQALLAVLDAPIPSALLLALPYALTIAFVVALRSDLRPPSAGGKAYVREAS